MKRAAFLLPLLAGTCFGCTGIFVRTLSQYVGSLTIVATRVTFGALLLGLCIAVLNPDCFRIRLKDYWLFFCSGVFGTVGLNICYNYAVGRLTMAFSALLLAMAPVFVIFFALLLFKEPLTHRKLFCVVLAMAGCLLTSGVLETSAGVNWSALGILIGAGGAVFKALYSIFFKLAVEKKYPSLTISFYSMLSAAVVLLPAAQWGAIGGLISAAPAKTLLFLFLQGLLLSAVPYTCVALSLNYMDAGKSSILTTCEPAVALVLGLLVYGEVPTALSLAGMCLVIAALVMLNLPDHSKAI